MKMRYIFSLIVSLTFYVVKSQNGKISGKIIDSKTGETLPGASILIEGTTMGGASDFDGNYMISVVPPGVYTVVCRYVSYADKKVQGVMVKPSEVTTINFSLEEPKGDTLMEVVIAATLERENTNTLFIMQKNNASVSDGVSAETIKKTPDRNTSDVLKRVSGAAIQDNKFAIIRGLNDRYNAAYINGAPLPSSESDRKAFSFDIFPSSMLDNLVIVKTATPELPADFGGGVIQINTKNIPDKNFQSIALGGGFNTITTFKERVDYEGGKLDWLGMDDGSRNLPSDVPSYGNYPLISSEQAELAKKMPNNWALQNSKFGLNTNFQYSIGRSVDFANQSQIGIVAAITYTKTYNFNTTERNSFSSSIDPNVPSQIDSKYLDKIFSEQTLSGALFNFSYKINPNHQLSLRTLFSLNADDRVIVRNGTPTVLDPNPILVKATARWFTSNQLMSSQLVGDHFLKAIKSKVNWVLGYTTVKRVIPNLRRSIYTRLTTFNDPSDPYLLDTVYSANISFANTGSDYGGSVFFSQNDEKIISFKPDITIPLDIKSIGIKNDLKLGLMYQFRQRDFFARQLGYAKYGVAGGNIQFKDSLLYLSEENIFSSQNMGEIYPGAGGFKLLDGTRPNDKYDALSILGSAFVMLDSRFEDKLRLIYGVRVESFQQQLNSVFFNKEPLKIDTKKIDVLPSVNFVYSINTKQNVRISYSHTLNRPEFRELAPFAFYDFNTNLVFSGNDTLKRALIRNYDLRYEIYPGRGQIFSITGFYKDFTNPIEQVARPDVAGEVYFRNVDKAKSYGAELEVRFVLGSLFGLDSSRFFNNLTVYSNFSSILSAVDVSNVVGSADSLERPLQGQSPYILNNGILYNDQELGFSVSVNLNRVGNRIAIVGSVNEPNIWENARSVLDFQIGKTFMKNKIDLKFNVRDIFAQELIFFQDRDGNKKYNKDVDDRIWVTTFGRTFSLSAAYKF